MTAITSTGIESNSYDVIFNILNTRANIPDPRGSTTRTFIYDADPFHKSIGFQDMPYIVFELPRVEYSKTVADGKHKLITWTHIITVRTTRDGSAGSRVDVGRSDMLSIADSLHSTFNSLTIRQTLRNNNIKFVDLKKVSSDVTVIDQKDVFESVYELKYQTRLQVSS